ncbi:MAG: hypothetical protein ACR2KK_01755 [Acidimicrobiales bacterium]
MEADLSAGRFDCVACGLGRLAPWGFARRRVLRDGGRVVELRPRRSRCVVCLVTHVLLPTVVLLRRRDLAEVIGSALQARFVDGTSRKKVAAAAGVPPDTSRGWLRRFVKRAEEIRVTFTEWAHLFDSTLGAVEPRGSPAADALEAIGAAAASATRKLGPAPMWGFVAGVSGGRLLSNTNCPLPPPS